jgi:hypothetical protein
VTALLNQWVTLSKNSPFTSAQMRVNADGTVNFSGTVDINRMKNFGIANNVPSTTMDIATKFVGVLGQSFPFSSQGTLSIKNNVVNDNFNSAKTGFIPIPNNILNGQRDVINNFIEERLSIVTNLDIEELSFSNGETTFKGTMPETIVFVK